VPPHEEQVAARGAPQAPQKRWPAGFSAAHWGHALMRRG
jgi:hypothetical protein